MEQLVLPLVAQLGIGAVFLGLLWVVYQDGKKERAYMMSLLERVYLKQKKQDGEAPELGDETLMRRP